MRTIIDLPDDQLRALDEVAAHQGVSRAEAVRRAVARYVGEMAARDDDAFGLWGDRVTDALAYEDELRGPRETDAVPRAHPAHGAPRLSRGGKRRGR